jgi:hypothetical protein
MTRDQARETEATDTIRRQFSHLVWGNVLKPASDLETETDASGNVVYEDIQNNALLLDSDFQSYQTSARPMNEILYGASVPPSVVDLPSFNKFIMIGKRTANSDLAFSDPDIFDYSVCQNEIGVLRLMILTEDTSGNPTYRLLNSTDSGENWTDGWRYLKDPTDPLKQVVRINSLSDGQDTEEGERVFMLYNDFTNEIVVFYFYLGAILCKFIPDQLLNSIDLDEISEQINEMEIYAVAGNLVNVENEIRSASGPDKKIITGFFQKNADNYAEFYSNDIYAAHTVAGYITKKGYIRIFALKDGKTVDGYFFDGNEWVPEQSVLGPSI